MGKETMNLVVDGELKRRFKSACALDNVNMSDVVAELVTEWLAKRETRQQDKTAGQDK